MKSLSRIRKGGGGTTNVVVTLPAEITSKWELRAGSLVEWWVEEGPTFCFKVIKEAKTGPTQGRKLS